MTAPTQIALAWTNTSTNLTGYHIDRANDNLFTVNPTTISIISLQPSYMDTGLIAGTTYYYRLRATNAAGDSGNSNAASATTATINTFPSPPWFNADVGAVGIAGSATYANGAFAQLGSGGDIWNNADAFNFTYQSGISGDFVLTARVSALGGSDPWAKAGVMVRQSIADAGAANAYMLLSYGNGFNNQYRSTSGAAAQQNPPASATANTAPNNWVSIARVSGLVSSFYSVDDGVSWTQMGVALGPVTAPALPLTDPVYVGLALTAHNIGLINPATFDHVSLALGTGAPVITQISPSGGLTAVATPITITGAGFTGATNLSIGGSSVVLTVVNNTTITATTPSLAAGPADVVVTTPAGTVTATGGFNVGALPTVASLSSTSGQQTGGTPITITGTNFGGATQVTFGSVPAQILSLSSSQIQVTVPA